MNLFFADPCHPENATKLEGVRENSTCGFKSGRIEICNGGVWKTICDSDWTKNDAAVACRQLGYSAIGELSNRIRSVKINVLPFSYFLHRGRCVAGILNCLRRCIYGTRM